MISGRKSLSSSPTKLLGDISNTIKGSSQGSDEIQIVDKNEPRKLSIDDIKTLCDKPLMLKILEKIHHLGSSYTIDRIVDDIRDVLLFFYVGETVYSRSDDGSAKVLSCERKGGLQMYTVMFSDNSQKKVNGNQLKRTFAPSDNDIRMIIETVSSKTPGKPWEVHEVLRKEYGVTNKIASLFCASANKNQVVYTVTDSSSEDEAAPMPRLSDARPPIQSKKAAIKPPKPAKQPKVNNKKTITSFTLSGVPQSPSTSNSFISNDRKNKISTAMTNMDEAFKLFKKADYNAAAHAAAVLMTPYEVLKVENRLHRFAIRKQLTKEMIRDKLKFIQVKPALKTEVAELTKFTGEEDTLTKDMMNDHFDQNKFDVSSLTTPLKCYGSEMCTPEEATLFADCLMITQFVAKDCKKSAVELFQALSEGRCGYYETTAPILVVFLGMLLQGDEFNQICLYNIKLHEFELNNKTASDICRGILMEIPKESYRKMGDNLDEAIKYAIRHCDNHKVSYFMKTFSSDKEFWQMTPDDQMGILVYLMEMLMDLDSYKEANSYRDMEQARQEAKENIRKCKEELESIKEQISELVVEVEDEENLSRAESRKLAADQKKKKALEDKRDEIYDDIERFTNNMVIAVRTFESSQRIVPIGEDRHFRQYYLFDETTGNAGLWIQDFGETQLEKLIKGGEFFTSAQEILLPSKETERWRHVPTIQEIRQLVEELDVKGDCEAALKKRLQSDMPEIEKLYRPTSASSKKSEDETTEGDLELSTKSSVDLLKATIKQFFEELRKAAFTSMATDAFSELADKDTFEDMKECLAAMVRSIPDQFIIVSYTFEEAKLTHSYSHCKKDKWISYMLLCPNPSSIHLMLSFLDSRIAWNKSAIEKCCKVCRMKKNSDDKMICSTCQTVYHYYCVKPRVKAKVENWTCAKCAPTRNPEEKRPYVEEDEEVDDDDYFSQKNNSRKSKRLADLNLKDYGEDSDDEEITKRPAKRTKVEVSFDYPECYQEVKEIFDKVKSENRMYRCLLLVPIPRSSRSHKAKSLEVIENSLHEYDSVDMFTNDLSAFLQHAQHHFEEHNERKVPDLLTLIETLDLQ